MKFRLLSVFITMVALVTFSGASFAHCQAYKTEHCRCKVKCTHKCHYVGKKHKKCGSRSVDYRPGQG